MQWIWQRRIDLWLLFFLFIALPFERIPSRSVGGFTVKTSYIVGVFLIAVTLLLVLVNRLKLSLAATDKTLVAFWLVAVLSLTQSTTLRRGAVIAAMWAFMFLIFYIISLGLKDKLWRERAEKAVLWATAAACVFGIYQFVGDSLGLPLHLTGLRDLYAKGVLGYPRIQSVALEPLYFSNYLIVPLAMAVRRMYMEKEKWKSYLSLTVLILVNIILGISRGAYLAVIVGIMVVVLWALWQVLRENKNAVSPLKEWWRFLVAAILSIILSFGLLSAFRGGETSKGFIGHASVNDTQSGTSVPGRLETYRMAFRFFKDHPILGIGLGDFGPRTLTSQAEFAKYGYGIVNNEYLEIAAELGLAGLITGFIFVWFYLKEVWKAYQASAPGRRWHIVVLTASLVALAVQYNFFSTLYIIYIWAFLAWIRAEIASEAFDGKGMA